MHKVKGKVAEHVPEECGSGRRRRNGKPRINICQKEVDGKGKEKWEVADYLPEEVEREIAVFEGGKIAGDVVSGFCHGQQVHCKQRQLRRRGHPLQPPPPPNTPF